MKILRMLIDLSQKQSNEGVAREAELVKMRKEVAALLKNANKQQK